MAIILRYVNKRGIVLERFIGLAHVQDTCASSLKEAVTSLLGEHNLSLLRIRGQGYDGASKMDGPFNGLKSLILRENPFAYYIHCFAHQLQLALVYVAQRNGDADDFFNLLNRAINLVGGSAKRRDMLRGRQEIKIIEALSHSDLQTRTGLNQELGLQRTCETHWRSNYKSILNMIANSSCVIEVLEVIGKDSTKHEQKK